MTNKLLHFNDDCPVCFGDGYFDAGDDAQGNSTNIDCPACKANQELAALRTRLAEAEKVIRPFAKMFTTNETLNKDGTHSLPRDCIRDADKWLKEGDTHK